MAVRDEDFGLWLIHFDPGAPNARLFESAGQAMAAAERAMRSRTIPWPKEWTPTPAKPAARPNDQAALAPHDILLVTWTAGEARTLAQLMTGDNFDDWFEYRHQVERFIPKVTGPRAPFNDRAVSEKRYYHSLGLYYPLKIGNISVLAFKSGLHMAYDGPDVPLVDLWKQLVAEVKPKLIITTGTGGGIGADVELGDVVLGGHVRFRLTGGLKAKPFHDADYKTSGVNEARVGQLITAAMLKPNGELLPKPRTPKMIYPSVKNANIVSTDTFAFDDSTDHFGLQALGKCCDMGDATLGLALSELGDTAPAWIAIRNASDPQIANPHGDMKAAKKEAERIYAEYQCVTTAGSVIASWAVAVAALGS